MIYNRYYVNWCSYDRKVSDISKVHELRDEYAVEPQELQRHRVLSHVRRYALLHNVAALQQYTPIKMPNES